MRKLRDSRHLLEAADYVFANETQTEEYKYSTLHMKVVTTIGLVSYITISALVFWAIVNSYYDGYIGRNRQNYLVWVLALSLTLIVESCLNFGLLYRPFNKKGQETEARLCRIWVSFTASVYIVLMLFTYLILLKRAKSVGKDVKQKWYIWLQILMKIAVYIGLPASIPIGIYYIEAYIMFEEAVCALTVPVVVSWLVQLQGSGISLGLFILFYYPMRTLDMNVTDEVDPETGKMLPAVRRKGIRMLRWSSVALFSSLFPV